MLVAPVGAAETSSNLVRATNACRVVAKAAATCGGSTDLVCFIIASHSLMQSVIGSFIYYYSRWCWCLLFDASCCQISPSLLLMLSYLSVSCISLFWNKFLFFRWFIYTATITLNMSKNLLPRIFFTITVKLNDNNYLLWAQSLGCFLVLNEKLSSWESTEWRRSYLSILAY